MARGLADAGAIVGLHGRDPAKVAAATSAIPGAESVVFDLTDVGGMERAVRGFIDAHGGLDVLVCNAGLRDRQVFLETTADTLRDLLETNLVANFELLQQVAPHMIRAGRGSVILVTTNAAVRGQRRGSTYSASKGGLDALTRALAVELGRHGVRVNALSPGFFATGANEPLMSDPAVRATVDSRVPLKRWAQPHEMIGPALFLASDASSYISGQSIHVDGGMSIAA
jgi:gluconate 5-dehydrogenase